MALKAPTSAAAHRSATGSKAPEGRGRPPRFRRRRRALPEEACHISEGREERVRRPGAEAPREEVQGAHGLELAPPSTALRPEHIM